MVYMPANHSHLCTRTPIPLQSNAQLDGAFEYLKRVGPGEVSSAELEEAAGVGVVVGPEEIAAAVGAALEAAKERLLEERCAAARP
jgi:glutaminyl-tRNA synthetase